ncbi:Acetyltransferase (GNAT) domain-containing protein [Bacillus sp. OV322]|uniref:GNAT family N-acetyltransferase n=1 Tax=Bacillus sp. OV322 TaxID=1882764 RepID=UPI0008DFE74A|nr:GNAT family N-acetyltransferase [Bacillus sp. OV322]SFC51819.1 Acetyltransferase (GNAT) domain-containing protein [Bacillus sp. OV322]
MDLQLRRTKMGEAGVLLNIQKEAFRDDLQKYRDYSTSPAAETRRMLAHRIRFSNHYTIIADGRIAGGVDIMKITKHHYRLFRIFLDTAFQNQGLGAKVIALAERNFPEAEMWSLNTPQDNFRNRYFYEKLGYKVVGASKINDSLSLLEYEKIL